MNTTKRYLINEIDVNTCKSPHCKNFAIPKCDDYIIPSFKLGFPALHCSSCGGNSLLINNKDLLELLQPYIIDYNKNIEKKCPKCMSDERICYGFTRKNRRYKCKRCKHVYTINSVSINSDLSYKIVMLLLSGYRINEILKKLEITSVEFYRLLYKTDTLLDRYAKTKEEMFFGKNCELQSNIFKTSCRLESNSGLNNDLLGLVTCSAESGYVFLASVNWAEYEVSTESQYQPTGLKVEEADNVSISIEQLYEKYASFQQRPNFDHYNYTNNNCSKLIFEPIILAHTHFQKIKITLKSNIITHCIYSDPFIRSACINAYGEILIKGGDIDIYYLISNDRNNSNNYIYKGSYKVGWWGNLWREYISNETGSYKYICKLTHLDILHTSKVHKLSLDRTLVFISSLKNHFSDDFFKKISPRVFISILRIFTIYFNYCYVTPDECSCPAKKSGLIESNLNLRSLFNAAGFD